MKKLKYLVFSILFILNLQLLYSQNATFPDDRVIKYDGDDGSYGLQKPSSGSEPIWEEKQNLSINYWVYLGAGEYYLNKLYFPLGQTNVIFYGQEYWRFEVKWDDGDWIVVRDEPSEDSGLLEVPFTTEGEHTIHVKYVNNGNESHEYSIPVSVVPQVSKRYYDNNGNTIDLWFGGTEPLNRPLLFIEGFDPGNSNYQSLYYSLSENFMTELRNVDADVFILNFANGGADMRDNAQVVHSAIEFVNSIKSSSQDQIVTGISMGGPVTRYALAKAEQDEINLNVSHFVSIDAPQNGAIMDTDFLNFIKNNQDNFELMSMAAKQLLKYNPYATNNEHDDFYYELDNLNGDGYPKQIENISVSFAPNSPNPNIGRWLSFWVTDVPFLTEDKHFYIYEENPWHNAGSYLPFSTTLKFGSAAGGLITWEFTRYLDPTFIQYESAHDIVDGVPKFDTTLASSTFNYHDNFPDDVIQPLMDLLYLSPDSEIEITFNNIAEDGNDVGGQLKLTENTGSTVTLSSGESARLLANETHTVKTLELTRLNFNNSGLDLIHHRWNDEFNEYFASHFFTGYENNGLEEALFKEANSVTIQNSLNTTAGIHIHDPWYQDASGNQPDDFRPLSEVAPDGQHEIFQNQNLYQGTPHYSVKADETFTSQEHSSEEIKWYFQNWSSPDGGADIDNESALQTDVVFRPEGDELIANYKGHLASSKARATGHNNGRRICRTSDGVLHFVYEDDGKIWYTKSTSEGETWLPEVCISNAITGYLNHLNPSINFLNNTLYVVWEGVTDQFYNEPLHEIFFRKGDASGSTTVWANEIKQAGYNTEPGDLWFIGPDIAKPVVCASQKEGLFVAWRAFPPESSSGYCGYVIRGDLDGNFYVDDNKPVEIPECYGFPVIEIDKDGGYPDLVIIWNFAGYKL